MKLQKYIALIVLMLLYTFVSRACTKPSANVGSSKSICIGGSASIGSTAVSGNTYSWTSNPSGFSSTNANPSVSPTTTTTYTLFEKDTTKACIDSNTNSVVITVNPLPSANAGTSTAIVMVVLRA